MAPVVEKGKTPPKVVTEVNIRLVPHTIFMLCGPTMCGKSTFALRLKGEAEALGLSTKIISSDVYRGHLRSSAGAALGPISGEDRHSAAALAVSRPAFELLYAELKAYTSFPVNTDVVIVDTTGMDPQLREDVRTIAFDQGYDTVLVTFEYRSREEYFPAGISEVTREVIEASRHKYVTRVLPHLGSNLFGGRIRIPNRFVKPVISNTEEIEYYQNLQVPFDGPVAVIRDSHECVEELRAVIQSVTEKYPGIQVVHVGDYLDKGGATAEMVNFIYGRYKAGDIFLEANHEAYNVGRLTGKITSPAPVEKTHFGAVEVLSRDADLAEKVFEVWDNSLPFLVIKSEEAGRLPVYLTHSPCRLAALGKVHGWALKAQRNYRIVDREVPLTAELEWLYQEAEGNHPLHIFGHVTHKLPEKTHPRDIQYRNKVFLDTGAVNGGALSCVVVSEGRIIDWIHQPATCVRMESEWAAEALGRGIPPADRPFDLNNYDLAPHELRLVHHVEANGIRYASGTMSPGPSTPDAIEGLYGAFSYLAKQGIDEVILEPKWMGSRAQVYLYKGRPELTFMTSRSGWKIRKIEGLDQEGLDAFMLKVYAQLAYLFEHHDTAIVDGELMPWSALGEGLISSHFIPYQSALTYELAALVRDEGLKALPEFREKLELEAKAEHAVKFAGALSQFTSRGEPEFKPFDILWSSNQDVLQLTTQERYRMVTAESYVTVKLSDPETWGVGQAFFEKLTTDLKMEGVVIKPNLTGVLPIPAMKVRSEEYLRLVYGYDWPLRIDKLIREKNISGKVRLSQKEYKLALNMLAGKPEDVQKHFVHMIAAFREEKGLDPRL